MLQLETTKAFEGFSNFPKDGDYFYSFNMHKSMYGIQPGWVVSNEANHNTAGLGALRTAQWFTQAKLSGLLYNHALDTSGNIWQSQNTSSVWIPLYQISTNNGNALIADQKNRLLYADKRYLGMWDGSAAYTAGTVAITNGSTDLFGTGTTWIGPHVGMRICVNGIWNTVSSVVNAGYITLANAYTGTTVTTATYRIALGFTDQWKDFGADSAPVDLPKPSETYEDWVYFGNGNNLAGLNTIDDSWNASAFSLPTGFVIKAVKSNTKGILIVAQFGSRSVLVLWDGLSDRSIAPWIWLNQQIFSLVPYNGKWLVIGSSNVFLTDGYTISTVTDYPDVREGKQGISCLCQGADVFGNYLIINIGAGNFNRNKSGLYIYRLQNDQYGFLQGSQWEFIGYNGMETTNISSGAVFNDSNKILLSFFGTPGYCISSVSNGQPNVGYYITPSMGVNDNIKVAEAVLLTLGFDNRDIYRYLPATANISVKVYNFRRPIWMYGQMVDAGTDKKTLVTSYDPSNGAANAVVGDEVTFLNGANAGLARHIVSITPNSPTSGKQTIVLDSDLAAIPAQNSMFNIQPFQLVEKKTMNSLAELQDLYFNIKNSVKGKKFLVKVLFENMNFTPELQGVSLVYDDLGII